MLQHAVNPPCLSVCLTDWRMSADCDAASALYSVLPLTCCCQSGRLILFFCYVCILLLAWSFKTSCWYLVPPNPLTVALWHLFIPPHVLSPRPINLSVWLRLHISISPCCRSLFHFLYVRLTSNAGTRLILMWTRLQWGARALKIPPVLCTALPTPTTLKTLSHLWVLEAGMYWTCKNIDIYFWSKYLLILLYNSDKSDLSIKVIITSQCFCVLNNLCRSLSLSVP